MKPLKKLLRVFLVVCVVSVFQYAHSQNLSTDIKVQAMDMASAFMKNDFATFSKYMHPAIITFAGGKEKMKAVMDSAYAAMKMFGVSFKRYWIGSPSEIIHYKDQLQAVLPASTVMKTPLGEVYAETSMLVISEDKGKNWYFVDTNVYKAEKIKNILPDISPQLVIPPMKKPKLVPNKSED